MWTKTYKYITVADLIKLLEKLQPTDRIVPNEVKNLLVVRNKTIVGMIDVANDKYDDYKEA